jgi:RNA polymerase sigma-70 factor (ECF subfamily)
MKGDTRTATSVTLLGRLSEDPEDQAAWGRFVDHYAPKIYGWCRKRGLQDADAEDVTQNVLLKLADKMRSFVYDAQGSFRAWLKTITQHACSDYLNARQRRTAGSGDSAILGLLENFEARLDLEQRLREAFDLELMDVAAERVRLRVATHTWEAFQLTAVEGWTGAAAAAKLGMKVATVFAAKCDVQKMLRQEIQSLDGANPIV